MNVEHSETEVMDVNGRSCFVRNRDQLELNIDHFPSYTVYRLIYKLITRSMLNAGGV